MIYATYQQSCPAERARLRVVCALAGTVFFMPLNLFVMEGCLVLALLLGAWYLRQYAAPPLSRTTLLRPIAGFALAALASLIGSPNLGMGVAFYIFTVLQYICLYGMVLYFVHGEKERRFLLWVFLMGAVCVVLYGFYQYLHMATLHEASWVDNEAFPRLQRRMYSTLYNPNLLSAFLLMVMGLAASMTVWTRHPWHRLLYGGLFAALAICLVLTYSRGSWLSVCGLVIFFGFVWDKRVWLLLAIVPLVLGFYHGGVTERLLSIFSHSEADTSVSMRLDMWQGALSMIGDHPVLGIGWGAFKYVYPLYNELIKEAGITIFHAHNMFLNIFAETGVVGFFFYLWFFFGHAWYAVRFLQYQHTSPFAKAIAMATAGAIISMAISGLSDYDLFSVQVSLTLWFLCSIFANMLQEKQKNTKNSLRNNSQ